MNRRRRGPDLESLAIQARVSPLGLGAYMAAKRPGRTPFQTPRHLLALNDAILEAVHGKRRRLIVAMPPQHAKSTTVSVLTPAWYLGTFPDRSVLLASYASKLARFLGRKARLILEQSGRETYDVEVSEDSAAAQEWRLDGFDGGMVSAGIAGDFRGRPGDLLIVDDPIKDSKQALSPGYLEMLWDWFSAVMEGRLSEESTVIVCATRLHERDLAGRLIAEQPGDWDVIRLPAIAEPDDPLGRKVGEALWPERYSAEYLAGRRRRVGEYWWSAEYQQSPKPAGGLIIRDEWIRHWGAPGQPNPRRFDEVILSADCNLKETTGGSYAVLQAWGRLGPDRFLLDQLRDRWGFEGLLAAFGTLINRFPRATRKLIEPTAAGPAAMAILKRKHAGILAAKSPHDSKVARLRAVAPVFESGNVYVPDPSLPGRGWVKPYVSNLTAFPMGDGTDEGDATSQALAHFETAAVASAGTSIDERARERRRSGRSRLDAPRRPIRRDSIWDGDTVGTFGRLR